MQQINGKHYWLYIEEQIKKERILTKLQQSDPTRTLCHESGCRL
jgi:hypothetical protein